MNAEVPFLSPHGLRAQFVIQPHISSKPDLVGFTSKIEQQRQARILSTSSRIIGICAGIDRQTWEEPYAQDSGALSLATYLRDLSKCNNVAGLLIGHGNPEILSRFSPTVLIRGPVIDQSVENQVSQAGQRMLKVFPNLIPTEVHELHVEDQEIRFEIIKWQNGFGNEFSSVSYVTLPDVSLSMLGINKS